MNTRFGTTGALVAALVLGACNPTPTPPPPPPAISDTKFDGLSTLTPGRARDIEAKLKVNVVMVGYEPTPAGQVKRPLDVNVEDFRERLPKTYRSLARIPSAYRAPGQYEYTGNSFTYEYNYVFASPAFEDEFFAYLSSIAEAKPLTVFQTAYNCQYVPTQQKPPCATPAPNVSVPVTSNHWIDAVKTERWLADNAGKIGVDTGQHTVFLVNWYGRPDFKFHVYTKTDAPEPDTGYNFGELRDSRKLNAFGGSLAAGAARRVWFYDLSAGPESWTANWNITNADVDGDEVPDLRLPPVWEYGTRKLTYRYFTNASAELAAVVRYVAINLLFTPSPIYRVELTPPLQPEAVQLDVTLAEGDSANYGRSVLKLDQLQERVSVLQPFASVTTKFRQVPLAGELAAGYTCFYDFDLTCSPNAADGSGARLFEYVTSQLLQNPDLRRLYVLPIYAFNAAQDPQAGGLLGIAIDDATTGTQSFAYSFLAPFQRNFYGLTTTTVHEVGHHLSLSHPHDGYDSETDVEYGPGGSFLFVNSGDASNSVMSYLDIALGFGQFDLDSQYRYLTAAYLNNANAILGLIEAAAKVRPTRDAVLGAEGQFKAAIETYNRLDYLGAAKLAHDAYRAVVAAAAGAGVAVQPYRWYENIRPLAAGQAARPRVAKDFLPTKGPAIRPETTPYLRYLRSLP